MSCDYHVTSHVPRLATVWPRETTDSSTSSWSPSLCCHFMSWGATWQWSSSVSTHSRGAVLPPLGEKDKPFPSLNIAPPSQSAGAWEGGYFVSNARENYLNFCWACSTTVQHCCVQFVYVQQRLNYVSYSAHSV